MQRTISAMVGKGSVNHNSRKFKAENVNADRSHLNIDYCNENIKKVYHELFDEALGRYNAKQTRADRKIENYYEKIRSSKQEKPFHELILQIGDKENMSAESENGQLARQVLDEYYRGFQERNSQLRVFSAHLHMDEATPHLHIDFVPFTNPVENTVGDIRTILNKDAFKGCNYTKWLLNSEVIIGRDYPKKIDTFDRLCGELLEVILGNKAVEDIDFDGIKKYVKDMHEPGNLQKAIIYRLDAMESYWNGEINKAISYLVKALNIALGTKKIPRWFINDIAIDLRNMNVIINQERKILCIYIVNQAN